MTRRTSLIGRATTRNIFREDLTIFHSLWTLRKKEKTNSSLIDEERGESTAHCENSFHATVVGKVIYTMYLVIRAGREDLDRWRREATGLDGSIRRTWNHAGTYSVAQTSRSSGYEAILPSVYRAYFDERNKFPSKHAALFQPLGPRTITSDRVQ